MKFEDRIRRGDFITEVNGHFFECDACGFKYLRRETVINHQLKYCDSIGYLEDEEEN